MGPLAAHFLFESLLAPFAVAGLVLAAMRRLRQHRLGALSPLLALALALGTAYILAFGWPSNPALGARNKIMLSALIGAIAGFLLARWPDRRTVIIAAGAIAIALWIGLPALQFGRPSSALLLLPITLALLALWLSGRADAPDETLAGPILLTLAVGLAAIAVFAKAFSLAQISLALAGGLLAVLIVGPAGLTPPALLLAAAMLLALAAALLLYSEANVPAVAILGVTLAAGRLARLTSGRQASGPSIPRQAVFCLLPAAVAILIARIDAGPISLY